MEPLFKEVEYIAHRELTRQQESRTLPGTPTLEEAADLALSYIAHMERDDHIAVDEETGQLLKNLDLTKWKRMAEDFSRWIAEGELSSRLDEEEQELMNEELLKSKSELYAAQVELWR